MASHSSAIQATQTHELLREMENRLIEKMNQSEQRMSTRMDELSSRIDRLERTLSVNDAKALARTLNSSARAGAHPLYPLPLPNGDPIPKSQFPETYGAFSQLEGTRLQELLQLYKLKVPPSASLDDQFTVLAAHFGIAW